jgi:anthranilate 1,2-dioxygenase small subunit
MQRAREPETELDSRQDGNDEDMDLDLQLTVENLLARYAHCIDDDRLEEWADFFVEKGRYKVTTAENYERNLPLPLIYADSRGMLRDRVAALRTANVYEGQRYRHTISCTVVERIDANTARALSNFNVVRIMHTGETMMFATGRYIDRVRIKGDGDRAQFEDRLVVLDSRNIDTLLAIPL